MKKLILLASLGMLCVAGQVHAQLGKGTRYWGTTVNFSGNNQKYDYTADQKYRTNSVDINPTLTTGWFIADNRMFGLSLTANLAFYKNKSQNFGTEQASDGAGLAFNLSPFIRHYKSINPKWALFLDTGLNLAYLRTKDSNGETNRYENGYSTGIFVEPGISYWITPRFSLESNVNVLYLALNYTSMNDANRVILSSNINTSLSQYFGIKASWYLQKAN